MLLCAGMGLDSLPVTQNLVSQASQSLQLLISHWVA
jgi:hypothetical protein